MDFRGLKQKSSSELQKILLDNFEKLRDMRFKIASKQLKNIREIRKVKKEIARINTLLLSKPSKDLKEPVKK